LCNGAVVNNKKINQPSVYRLGFFAAVDFVAFFLLVAQPFFAARECFLNAADAFFAFVLATIVT